MKKIRTFFGVFSAFLLGMSLLQAGAPVKSYSVSKKDAAVSILDQAGTTVYAPIRGDTLNNLFLANDGIFVELAPIDYENQAPALEAMSLPFTFSFGNKEMTHVGITAGGFLFFSDSSKVCPVVDANMTNLTWLQHYTVLQFKVKTGENWGWITWNQAVITAGDDTKVVVYNDESNGIYYIGFKDLQVMDTANKASLTASFQYALHSDGTLGFEVISLQPVEGTTTVYGVQAGILGEGSNDVVYLTDWVGGYSNRVTDLQLTDESYPSANTGFEYTLPASCTTVDASTINLTWDYELTESSLSFDYRTSWENAEALLVILSESETLSDGNLPVNGTIYDANSVVGSSVAVRVGTLNGSYSFFTGGSIDNLEGSTRYYLHAFPYNVACADGPLYGTPSVTSIMTPIAAPEGTAVSSVGKDQIGLTVGTNAVAQAFMIGFSETGVPDVAEVELEEGKVYKAGDIIEVSGGYGNPTTYSIQILDPAYKETTYTASGLTPGKPYHFYVWSVKVDGEDTTYSLACQHVAARTIATIPATIDFSLDFANTSPVGWVQEETNDADFFISELDGVKYMAVQMVPTYDGNAGGHKLATATVQTPLFNPGAYAKMTAILDVKYYMQGSFGDPTPGTHGENDTILIQVKQGEEWVDVHQILKSNVTVASDGTAKVYTPEFSTTGDDIQLRLVCKSLTIPGMSTPYFALKSLTIEPVLNCKNVSELAVVQDRTTHESAVLNWKDGNTEFADFMVRYRAEDGEWIGEGQMTGKKIEFEITGLEAHSTYVAQVTAVCGEGDTSLSREISFTTMYSIPYEAPDPYTLDKFPSEIQSLMGEIATEGATVMTEPDRDLVMTGWDMVVTADYMNMRYGIGDTKYSNHSWMILPNLSVGSVRGTASLDFTLSAYALDEGGSFIEPQFDQDTLYIYNSANGEYNVNTPLIAKIGLEGLSKDKDSSFSIEFPVEEAFNQIAFYYVEGESQVSNSLLLGIPSVQMKSVVCEPVGNIRQSDLGKTSVTISWEGSSMEYALMYKDRRSEEGYDTVFTEETSITLSDLTPGTAYVYQIVGYCGEGRTNASEPSSERYFNTVDECYTPTLEVIDVTWQSARFAMSSEEKTKLLRIYAQDLETYPSIDYYVNTELDTVRVTGLFAELQFPYYAQVRAICSPGDSSAWSEKVSFTTEPLPNCGTPSNLESDVDIEGKTATLTWKMGENNDYVMLLTKEASASKFDTTGSEAESFIMRDLKLNTTYTWKLTGICDDYLQSKEASATFSTEATAIESVNGFAGSLRVLAENHQLVVENPEGQFIRALEIYSLEGRLLRTYPTHTNDNVFVVTDVMQQMVIVRVIGSDNHYASYKVLLF